eukprot:TRINITY_DN1172_c0_g1_i3.p1 TRINITY_DN1172_c0_g1~~TRINITY_DN1172_c0_g1_i3.p1  ORF type:complete len:182 (+),score=36.12 TRINITY_DN1172_c0_g1_i3:66-611(+)
MSEDRIRRLNELRENSQQRRLRIEELKNKIQTFVEQGDMLSLDLQQSTTKLALEEDMLQKEQQSIQNLEMFLIPDYLDKFEDIVEESSNDERSASTIKKQETQSGDDNLENSQTWGMVEPQDDLLKSTTMVIEEIEPGPGILSRAVGGVVSLFSWGHGFAAAESSDYDEFSCVHCNWYGRR